MRRKSESFGCFTQGIQKSLAIIVATEDEATLKCAGDDVITRVFEFHADRTSHYARRYRLAYGRVKCQKTDGLVHESMGGGDTLPA